MNRGIPILLARTGAYLILSLVVLGVVGWAYWAAAAQVNDAVRMVDVDWAGRHLCPNKGNPELNLPLTHADNRPDEDELWRNRIQSDRMRTAEFIKAHCASENEKNYQTKTEELILAKFMQNEHHYRVEVRRTIREMELGHSLFLGSLGQTRPDNDLEYDDQIGVPIIKRFCYIKYPEHAHDCARRDVLHWYASKKQYPANSTRFFALTPRSSGPDCVGPLNFFR